MLTLVDATQAAGWLPLEADRFDFLVAAGYKWLISPRGTAWMTVAPGAARRRAAAAAGWFAGDDPYEAYIGPPLRLADDARRLDTSPAWFSYVGSPAGARAARGRGRRGDPRAQRPRGEPLPRRASACRRATRRSCRFPLRATSAHFARRESRPPCPAGGCASASTSTTTKRTPTGRSTSSQRRRRQELCEASSRLAGETLIRSPRQRPRHSRLVLDVRQPAELLRQVPVAVAEQLHRGREQDRPDQRGVDEDRHGEADAQLLEHDRGERREDAEHRDHHDRRARDRADAVERMPCETASSVVMPRSNASRTRLRMNTW